MRQFDVEEAFGVDALKYIQNKNRLTIRKHVSHLCLLRICQIRRSAERSALPSAAFQCFPITAMVHFRYMTHARTHARTHTELRGCDDATYHYNCAVCHVTTRVTLIIGMVVLLRQSHHSLTVVLSSRLTYSDTKVRPYYMSVKPQWILTSILA